MSAAPRSGEGERDGGGDAGEVVFMMACSLEWAKWKMTGEGRKWHRRVRGNRLALIGYVVVRAWTVCYCMMRAFIPLPTCRIDRWNQC